MQLTYLLIDFLTVIICFVFSFHPKIRFNRYFGAFFLSSFIVGLVFIGWDIWFTKTGVWWFNDKYITGFKIFELPIEEILFFICIPFSCIFTYFCLDKFFDLDWKTSQEKIFIPVSIIIYLIIAIYFRDNIYTLVTFLSLSITLLILYFVMKSGWIGKATTVYLLLFPGFLTVNGILTGTGLDTPVVNYNPEDYIGLRIFTIPIEDFFYGYEMILWNLFLFKKFSRKNSLDSADIL